MPCMQAQAYAPPFKPSTCTPAEVAQIQGYGPDFMAQFLPVFDQTKGNGAFLDACIIHGSTTSKIDGVTNGAAFQQWLAGGQALYIMQCDGSNSTGPCDTAPVCAPF